MICAPIDIAWFIWDLCKVCAYIGCVLFVEGLILIPLLCKIFKIGDD